MTGGCGFIGSALCRNLVGQAQWSVLNVDCLTYAASTASLSEIDHRDTYSFLKANVCDRAAIDAALRDFQPDAIMHLAAESHVDRSITGSAPFIETNVVGTHTMLEAALAYWLAMPAERKDAFRFLHVSTDEVFGSLGAEGLFSEATPFDPRSPYSASKAASDHLVSAWGHTYGLPVLISNCSNNYGPYHFPEKLIPLMIINALEGKPLPVYGDGRNVRDWLYVDDHVHALKTILQKGAPGQTYCVGGRNERANIDVVHIICDLLDARAEPLPSGKRRDLIRFVADRPGHDKRYAIDATKLESELGWRAQHTFETGIAATVDWYLTHRAWWEPIRAERYAGERLGVQ